MQSLFQSINDLAISKAINESNWIFAMIQAFHLVSLAVFAGAVLVVDLRLLGRGFKQQTLADVTRDAQPWLIGGFIALVATVRRKVTLADEGRVRPFWSKVVGLVSIVLWLGVAVPARLIGLF
ncbi:MAG: hypothetical protein HYU27_10100 [Acidobacteria bacterium]|nr:hypothetical protein [Acidobacteriota bacterium]